MTAAGAPAHLVGYRSPASGFPVTVLAVPYFEADSWGETYYLL